MNAKKETYVFDQKLGVCRQACWRTWLQTAMVQMQRALSIAELYYNKTSCCPSTRGLLYYRSLPHKLL